MADTAAGIVGWLDSSPTAPAQMAASIVARNAATKHDAGHGTVSKTSWGMGRTQIH